MRVLVTGASGFLGGAVARRLAADGVEVHVAVRDPATARQPAATVHRIGDIGPDSDWRGSLAGIDCVVHCAARVHVLKEAAADPLAEFRRVNTEGTVALARQAVTAGVRRFVFVSTIGVQGAETAQRAFRPDDPPAPNSPYAQSKLEAEQALAAIGAETGLEIVVVRPPLIYGRDAPGNFAQLLRLVRSGLPLPLGSVHNLRSFVAVDNVADLLARCTWHPRAAGEVLLVSDARDVSTPDFIRAIARACGRGARLLPVPVSWLRFAARVVGVEAQLDKLIGSLQLDVSRTVERLEWRPPLTLEAAMQTAVGSAT